MSEKGYVMSIKNHIHKQYDSDFRVSLHFDSVDKLDHVLICCKNPDNWPIRTGFLIQDINELKDTLRKIHKKTLCKIEEREIQVCNDKVLLKEALEDVRKLFAS